jgi:hypothetical protein
MNNCDHKFVHLDTTRWTDMSGTYAIGFFKVDRFFCEKCLEQKEVKKEAWQRDTPDWYREGK